VETLEQQLQAAEGVLRSLESAIELATAQVFFSS